MTEFCLQNLIKLHDWNIILILVKMNEIYNDLTVSDSTCLINIDNEEPVDSSDFDSVFVDNYIQVYSLFIP